VVVDDMAVALVALGAMPIVCLPAPLDELVVCASAAISGPFTTFT
jgi:hypothetical protein